MYWTASAVLLDLHIFNRGANLCYKGTYVFVQCWGGHWKGAEILQLSLSCREHWSSKRWKIFITTDYFFCCKVYIYTLGIAPDCHSHLKYQGTYGNNRQYTSHDCNTYHILNASYNSFSFAFHIQCLILTCKIMEAESLRQGCNLLAEKVSNIRTLLWEIVSQVRIRKKPCCMRELFFLFFFRQGESNASKVNHDSARLK